MRRVFDIVDNREAEKIALVTHLGGLVGHDVPDPTNEGQCADATMAILDTAPFLGQ